MLSPGRIILLVTSYTSVASAGQTIGVLRSQPLPSPQELANLESRVLQNPDDTSARFQLLQLYLETIPPSADALSVRRSIRQQHILYLVEHHPEIAATASKVAYVYRASDPYANAADHDSVRDQWLAAVQEHPGNTAVTINAVRFLQREDQEDAERVLRDAVNSDPANRELAANLGFLYAKEILGSDLAAHAREELEQSSNAVVLAAAGTALPNLAVKADGARIVDPKIFDLASELSDRARQLAPDDRDIQGPMPLITYFPAAVDALRGDPPSPVSSPPSRIRVAESVQTANLIRKTQPQRPADVQMAGDVRFVAIIGRDGTIQNLELISGHRLLVEAARTAAATWLYKPTLLNGAPVEVVTTITVSFPLN
jgi:Gram-negative bacterial TonB protein C-terminal